MLCTLSGKFVPTNSSSREPYASRVTKALPKYGSGVWQVSSEQNFQSQAAMWLLSLKQWSLNLMTRLCFMTHSGGQNLHLGRPLNLRVKSLRLVSLYPSYRSFRPRFVADAYKEVLGLMDVKKSGSWSSLGLKWGECVRIHVSISHVFSLISAI